MSFGARRDTEQEQRATTLELFYDLVFVFAITQVSHLLLTHLTFLGVGQATLVLLVVWWAWNYTTWLTNELDPESIAVRLVLIAVMLASLLMAVAIPGAFGDRAALFIGSYLAIQLGRHSFLAFAAGSPGTIERERAARILTWFALAGVFWVAGVVVDGPLRAALWLVALAVDYGAPLVVFRVPGRAQLRSDSWDVETAHFAERFQLFVIIALGESIVVIGATTTSMRLSSARVAAFCLAFLSTAAFWWLYFNYAARMAERRLELARDRTRMARDAYTYLHVVMIAGIIVSAVGDEIVIAHPTAVLGSAQIAAVVAGPAIFLLAQTLFRLRTAGTLNRRRLGGAVACAAVAAVGPSVPALVLGALLVLILVGVIVSEFARRLRREARGEPTPLERLDASAAAGSEGTGAGPV